VQIFLSSAAFFAAAICAGLMGYAIQRGATCTVAAMDEVVRKRSAHRLVAMGEASLWVVGGLVIAQCCRVLRAMPGGYEITWATIAGGALLGFGAYVNKACVFGAIARLGSGEWAYCATPAGFYAGCVSAPLLFPVQAPRALPHGSAVLASSSWVALAFAALMIWRLAHAVLASDDGGRALKGSRFRRLTVSIASRVWSPHAATTVIGVTFLLMLLLVGAWAYTDVLIELARGMASNSIARGLLLLALFAGAMLGGYTAGRWRSTPVSLAQLAKCFAGGALMGWGSLSIPGGNDGLILLGMPLLWPYAWVAFLTMCATFGIALVAERTVMGQGAEHAVH
jgi:toxin CptA